MLNARWAAVRRSAMTLAESGNLLIMRNRAPAWVNAAKKLTDVGSAAYQAAQTKDAKALAALADAARRTRCTDFATSRFQAFEYLPQSG